MKRSVLLIGIIVMVCLGCNQNEQQAFKEQQVLAEQGNYWAKYELWQAYSKGKYQVTKDQNKADELLADLVQDVYLVSFEPAGDFNPQTPEELLENFNDASPLRSAKESIGGASFFRTKVIDNQLVGSFLTDDTTALKNDIMNNPLLHFLSIEKMTPELFVEYENSIQETINK
ncbi:MAG TPA: hypothetical protein PLP19_12950 [bacterium]|nr:hypothetical protein [bacterium]HPN44394.1 hypothetical protein [bacterium]